MPAEKGGYTTLLDEGQDTRGGGRWYKGAAKADTIFFRVYWFKKITALLSTSIHLLHLNLAVISFHISCILHPSILQ